MYTSTYIYVIMNISASMQMGVTTDNVESSLRDLQTAVSNVTQAEDESNINLDTITDIFDELAHNSSIEISPTALESAANIVADIQSWNKSTLQNHSSEYVSRNICSRK